MATKYYGIKDNWTDDDVANVIEVASEDGSVSSVKVNGVEYGGGGGSIEMETGILQPNADSNSITATFSNAHTEPATFAMLVHVDVGDNVGTDNAVVAYAINYYNMMNAGAYEQYGADVYGMYANVHQAANGYESSAQGPMYFDDYTNYLDNEKAKFSGHYKAGETYKWVAYWLSIE